MADRRWSIPTIVGLIGIHIGAICALVFYRSWEGLTIAGLLWGVCGCFGICVGFHRLLTHASFETSYPMKCALAILGQLNFQGPLLKWVADHRKHHKYSDKPGDPHSPRDGLPWSHCLWLCAQQRTGEVAANYKQFVPDLLKERTLYWISRLYGCEHILLAIVLFCAGWVWDGPWMGLSFLFCGIFLRIAVVWHITWAVNSIGHKWGYKRYETGDDSVNNFLVGLLSFGEGFHNGHHRFPTAADHGQHAWWEFDATYWVIRGMALLRLARNVKTHWMMLHT